MTTIYDYGRIPLDYHGRPVNIARYSVGTAGNTQGLLNPDGTRARVPFVLLSTAIPIGRAPSGTMGDNGALTVGTSLTKTYSDGVWLYFLANAVYSGSPAGFYWVVMTSDTQGTVYDNIYNPTTQAPYIPASPTPITATGPGAYTGVTANVTAVRVEIPGGLLGESGILRVDLSAINNNSGTNKGLAVQFAGTSFTGFSTMTTNITQRILGTVVNMRSDRQAVTGALNTSSSDVVYRLSSNTNVMQPLSVVISGTTATDWVVLQHFFVEVIPS